MQIENALLREAASVASKQAVRRVHLLAEMMRLESRIRHGVPSQEMDKLSRDAEHCARAAERLILYNPVGAFCAECPNCWILDGEHVRLRSDTGGNGLRCDKCDWRYRSRAGIGMTEPRTNEPSSFRTQPPSKSGTSLPPAVQTATF